jgi:preprotein translocase subunit SecG
MVKVFIVIMIVICLAGIIYLLKETKEEKLPRSIGLGDLFNGCLGGCLPFVFF